MVGSRIQWKYRQVKALWERTTMKDIKHIYIELNIEFTHTVELQAVFLFWCSYIDS